MPCYQTILENDYDLIFLLKEGVLSVRQIMCVLELEKNVKHGYLPFIKKTFTIFFFKSSKKVEGSDDMDLLKYCENEKKS